MPLFVPEVIGAQLRAAGAKFVGRGERSLPGYDPLIGGCNFGTRGGSRGLQRFGLGFLRDWLGL